MPIKVVTEEYHPFPILSAFFAMVGALILLNREPAMSGWIWLAAISGLVIGLFHFAIWLCQFELFD